MHIKPQYSRTFVVSNMIQLAIKCQTLTCHWQLLKLCLDQFNHYFYNIKKVLSLFKVIIVKIWITKSFKKLIELLNNTIKVKKISLVIAYISFQHWQLQTNVVNVYII